MDRVHEGVHGPGPRGWSMDVGSMFCDFLCLDPPVPPDLHIPIV